MTRPRPDAAEARVDALYAKLLEVADDAPAIAAWLSGISDPALLVALLRRPAPRTLLEMLAGRPPWSREPRVLAGVVLNPRVPRPLAVSLMPSLFWRDLAIVAASARVHMSLRVRAEAELRELLRDLRPGERITLGRLATPALLRVMLVDADGRVTEACLQNPRLFEEDLLHALRQDGVPAALIERTSEHHRWRDAYRVRRALVLQPRTPLGIALAQMSALVPADLRRIAGASALHPLIQATAARLLERGRTP